MVAPSARKRARKACSFASMSGDTVATSSVASSATASSFTLTRSLHLRRRASPEAAPLSSQHGGATRRAELLLVKRDVAMLAQASQQRKRIINQLQPTARDALRRCAWTPFARACYAPLRAQLFGPCGADRKQTDSDSS